MHNTLIQDLTNLKYQHDGVKYVESKISEEFDCRCKVDLNTGMIRMDVDSSMQLQNMFFKKMIIKKRVEEMIMMSGKIECAGRSFKFKFSLLSL